MKMSINLDSPRSLFEVSSIASVALQTFDSNMQLAAAEKNLVQKRTLYNHIFETLRFDLDPPRLFKLLEAYASSTCYNQTFNNDGEEGFRRSARLMELSLCLQLNHLNLLSEDTEWNCFDTLDGLIQNLEIGKEQKGKYFSILNDLNIDKDCLHQAAYNQGITELLKDSLIRLAYSYQNIAALKDSNKTNIALHSRLNEFVEKFLETDPKGNAEFAYNRLPFMVGLEKPGDVEAKINAYKGLLPLFKVVLPDFDYNRKEAQVFNMLGINLASGIVGSIQNYMEITFARIALTQNEKTQQAFTKAQECFLEADKIHSHLLKEASEQELSTQKFLSANAKSSLLICLVVADKLDEAKIHVDALKDYLKELDLNNDARAYRPGYEKVIKLYEEALQAK
jgi:hypothetical protein